MAAGSKILEKMLFSETESSSPLIKKRKGRKYKLNSFEYYCFLLAFIHFSTANILNAKNNVKTGIHYDLLLLAYKVLRVV